MIGSRIAPGLALGLLVGLAGCAGTNRRPEADPITSGWAGSPRGDAPRGDAPRGDGSSTAADPFLPEARPTGLGIARFFPGFSRPALAGRDRPAQGQAVELPAAHGRRSRGSLGSSPVDGGPDVAGRGVGRPGRNTIANHPTRAEVLARTAAPPPPMLPVALIAPVEPAVEPASPEPRPATVLADRAAPPPTPAPNPAPSRVAPPWPGPRDSDALRARAEAPPAEPAPESPAPADPFEGIDPGTPPATGPAATAEAPRRPEPTADPDAAGDPVLAGRPRMPLVRPYRDGLIANLPPATFPPSYYDRGPAPRAAPAPTSWNGPRPRQSLIRRALSRWRGQEPAGPIPNDPRFPGRPAPGPEAHGPSASGR